MMIGLGLPRKGQFIEQVAKGQFIRIGSGVGLIRFQQGCHSGFAHDNGRLLCKGIDQLDIKHVC